MPRSKPKQDHAHFVFAIKNSEARAEASGEISMMKATMISKLIKMSDQDLINNIGSIAEPSL